MVEGRPCAACMAAGPVSGLSRAGEMEKGRAFGRGVASRATTMRHGSSGVRTVEGLSAMRRLATLYGLDITAV